MKGYRIFHAQQSPVWVLKPNRQALVQSCAMETKKRKKNMSHVQVVQFEVSLSDV